MRFHRPLLAVLAALLLVSGAMAPVRAKEVGVRHIYISGKQYPGAYGDLAEGHAALQVRPVLEALGYSQIVWSPVDGSTTIYGLPESPVVLRPGDPTVQMAYRSITLPIAPYIKNGRLHAPFDFFRQAVGVRVEWVSATYEVEITPPPYSEVDGFGPYGAGAATFSALGRDGTGRLYLAVADGPKAGIWRSADQGISWQQVEQGLTGDPADARFITGPSDAVYLLLGGRLWGRSPSIGSWTLVPGLDMGQVVDAALTTDGTLWAAVDSEPDDDRSLAQTLYRLDPESGEWQDAGLNVAISGLTGDAHGRLWVAATWGAHLLENGEWRPMQWEPTFRVFQILSSPDDPQWVWALTHEGVRVSQDGGQTWQMSPGITEDPAALAGYKLAAGVGQEIFLLKGEGGVLYSPTGGGEWFRLTGYWPDAQVLDATMAGEVLLLATTSGGVLMPQRIPQPDALALPRLAPGQTDWGANLFPDAKGAGAFWLDPAQPDVAYALVTKTDGRSDYWMTEDGGASWELMKLPAEPVTDEHGTRWMPAFVHHPTRSGHYAFVYLDGIHITTDGGATWSVIPEKMSPMTRLGNLTFLESGRLIGSWESRAGSRVVYSDDYQSFQTVDGGPTWHISSLVTNPAVPDRIYACDWTEGKPCQTSADGGETWQHLAVQPPAEAGPPVHLIWSPAAPDELIAGRFVSRDGGQSWEPLPFFEEGDKLIQIAVDPADPLRRAAVIELPGGAHEVLDSEDGGQTWHSLGRPRESTWVHGLRFDARGQLWVGCDIGLFVLR